MSEHTPQENAHLIWDFVLSERPNPTDRLQRYQTVLQRFVKIVPPDSENPDYIELQNDWDRMTHDTYATLTIKPGGEVSYHQETYWHEGEGQDDTRKTEINFDAQHPTTQRELGFLARSIRENKPKQ